MSASSRSDLNTTSNGSASASSDSSYSSASSSAASSSSYRPNGATFFVPTLERLAATQLIQSLGGIEKTKAFLLQNPTLEQPLKPVLDDFYSQTVEAARLLLLGDTITADAMVEENPLILSCVVDAQDRRGNKVKGTLIEIAALAGDCNVRDKKPPEKDHGIIERWKAHRPEEAIQELRTTRPPGWEEETAARMQPYMDAATALLNEIIVIRNMPHAPDLSYEEFEDACVVPITKFKERLAAIPHEQPVITTGLIFDLQILDKFIDDLLIKNIDRLGGWNSVASDLFAIKGLGGLQMCASVCDLQAMVCKGKGLYHVINEGLLPDRSLNFSSRPRALAGLGDSFFVDLLGIAGRSVLARGGGLCVCLRSFVCFCRLFLAKLCAGKNSIVAMCYATARQSDQESVCNPVAFFNSAAATSAAAGQGSQQDLINHSSNSSYCQASAVPTHQSAHCRK